MGSCSNKSVTVIWPCSTGQATQGVATTLWQN